MDTVDLPHSLTDVLLSFSKFITVTKTLTVNTLYTTSIAHSLTSVLQPEHHIDMSDPYYQYAQYSTPPPGQGYQQPPMGGQYQDPNAYQQQPYGAYPPQQAPAYDYSQAQGGYQQGGAPEGFGPPKRQDSFGPPAAGGFQHGQQGAQFGMYDASNPQGHMGY